MCIDVKKNYSFINIQYPLYPGQGHGEKPILGTLGPRLLDRMPVYRRTQYTCEIEDFVPVL